MWSRKTSAYKSCVFVDVGEYSCVKRQFLERFDLVTQWVQAVVFHALRSRLQQYNATQAHATPTDLRYILLHNILL